MSAFQHPRLITLPRAAVLLLALLLATAVLGSARPAAAQTEASRGELFDDTIDLTLPAPALSPQLTNNPTANDGWVHFPFSVGDIRTLLAGPTFNGSADIPRKGVMEVRTRAAAGFRDEIFRRDSLIFGLSPTDDANDCVQLGLLERYEDEPSSPLFRGGDVARRISAGSRREARLRPDHTL